MPASFYRFGSDGIGVVTVFTTDVVVARTLGVVGLGALLSGIFGTGVVTVFGAVVGTSVVIESAAFF